MMTPEREMLDESIMLSEHFSLREMTRSARALERCIDNTPPMTAVANMIVLCQRVLEPVRSRFGVTRVTSGYRSPLLNEVVGGVKNSQHTKGEAADIHLSSMETGRKMFDFIRDNLEFDQLLLEHCADNGSYWLHVSYTRRRKNRHDARKIEAKWPVA